MGELGAALGITARNAASRSQLFLILACVWFLMAFVSWRRKATSGVFYGIIGTLFSAIGVFALVLAVRDTPSADRSGLLLPFAVLALLIGILAVGLWKTVIGPLDDDEDEGSGTDAEGALHGADYADADRVLREMSGAMRETAAADAAKKEDLRWME